MPDPLGRVLARGQGRGLIGPGDLKTHRRHAEAFARAAERTLGSAPGRCCDLGSGAGLPGLALAVRWVDASITLLEASATRARFLRTAIEELGLGARVSVAEGRAEELARSSRLEEAFALVCARAFGPPATTAECAARLLAPAGTLLVAEPPDPRRTAQRWPSEGLAQLGLGRAVPVGQDPAFVAIPRTGPCPPEFPRRVGVPSKRPLF